jgi:cytochrome c oxidase cbb3-type subunit 4
MDYHFLREFADSWGLLFMVVFFIAVILFAFRPGSRSAANKAAQIPLKDEDDEK